MKFSTNFHKIADGIDVAPLLALLAEHAGLWELDTRRQSHAGSAHGDTDCIILRGPSTTDMAAIPDDLSAAVPTPAWAILAPEMRRLLRPLIEKLEAPAIGRVLIARLKPGGVITEHIDEGAYAKAFARFHIVLTSDEGNEFQVEDEQVHMRPGTCWWFAHRRLHTVRNLSDTPRVHLIFDVISPRYLVERQDRP